MAARLKYVELAPEGMARMSSLEHYLNTETGLEPVLLDLVRLLASLRNGCEYCIHLHTVDLKKLNETPERIATVGEWRGSNAYTQRERAAFAWTEAVTNIQDGHAPDAVYDKVRAHFTEVETVNITLTVTNINAWNRIAIALGKFSRPRGRGRGGGLSESMLRAVGVAKVYPAVAAASAAEGAGRAEVVLFRGLDFSIARGEMVAIVGESGSGKSSLLHLLAALDTPSSGDVWMGDVRVGALNARAAAEFRNREVGYVWQFHYLLPEFTALENVAMPLLSRGQPKAEALEKARYWLGEVGLAARAGHRSGELSGGEQQRVSLARALVTGPKLLLADEPTGDLDGKTAEAVFGLIQRLHIDHGLTSVLVTHSMEFAARCGRMLRLRDGRLEERMLGNAEPVTTEPDEHPPLE